uniref:Acyl-CoA:lysophosphatidylglycerol acyltransferase 1-like n=1 Tax=Phallusia mammillata TaxID=59560 RepID=A0A6F9DKH0_9ASCI|nr:acyl-CoA:lysophosphatidylglycerol acyltransferase 1-like [Phallusia mammillata]
MEQSCFTWVMFFKQLPYMILYIIQSLLCPPVYLIWYLLLQPIKLWNPDYFWLIEGQIYDSFLGIVGSWSDLSGHVVYESGADVSVIKNDVSLVIVNHQTPTDIPLLMRAFHAKCLFPTTMWVMDWILQFFNFGWVAKGHGDFFLLQGTDARKLPSIFKLGVNETSVHQAHRLKENLTMNVGYRNHGWVILFPEGGLLWKRRDGSQRFAKKMGLPILQNVTYPRLGALQTAIETLLDPNVYCPQNDSNSENQISKKSLKWIVDVTIGYKTSMNVFQYLCGCFGTQKATLHYRVFPIEKMVSFESIHEKPKVRENWLFSLFQEKEAYLKHFAEKGFFPQEAGKSEKTVIVKPINNLKVYGIQLLVIFTIYIMFHLF